MGKKIMTEQEYREYVYKKADKIKNKKDLDNLLKEIINCKELDYGKIVYAICGAMIGTCNYINRSPVDGITGFQAGFIGWEMIKEFTIRLDNEYGMKIINYGDMLYPQNKEHFDKTISPLAWEKLQEEAKKRLEKHPDAHSTVINHWKSMVCGKVPFGYKIKED